MELKDQVQGVVIGLFGAYAGGYFADLTSQAETGNPVALVEGLVNLQTPLLGVNLSDDAAWVDTILGHLGVSSTSAAYTAAAAWANGELDAGASRAEVVLAAVTYLLGDSVEAQYASVATAFKADVAAGVEYSEGAGAEVLAIGDLREAAGNPATGTSFNLTAALAAVAEANGDVAAFVKAWGLEQDPVDKAATAAKIYAATETKEAAIDALATTAAGAAQTYNVTGETSGSGDKIEDARLIIINENVATREKALDKTVTDTKANADKVSTSLAAAVESYTAAVETQTAATLARNTAVTAVNSKLNELDAADADVTAVTPYVAGATTLTVNEGTTVWVATYDTAAGTWSYTKGGVASAAPTAFDLSAAQAAAVSAISANVALTQANTAVTNRLDAIARIDGDQFTNDTYSVTRVTTGGVTLYAVDNTASDATWVDAANASWSAAAVTNLTQAVKDTIAAATTSETATYTSGSATTFDAAQEAKLYADALAAVVQFDKDVAKLNTAIAAVNTARADSTELAALEKAATDAAKVITDEGFNVVSLKTADNVTATAKDDVFLLGALSKDNEAATINDFGFTGDDVIYIGSDYTFNTGKVATDGDDAVLEVFATQNGANVELTFETVAYGSNTAPAGVANPEAFVITLTGVTLADVSISNGFIQLA